MCIGHCTDPVVNTLKGVGYNMVRLPKADIRPNELLLKSNGTMNRIGGIDDLFLKGTIDAPTVGPDVVAADVSGKRTNDVNVGLGLTLLGTVIRALGGNLGLETAYKDARSVVFEFSDIQSNSVKMIDVVKYINSATLSPYAPQVVKMLEADSIYVITSTVKSTKITVEAKRDNGQSLQLDVPAVQQIVGANIKVSAEAGSLTKITYAGNIPLIFGIQAYQLFYDKGKFTEIKPAPDGIAMAAGANAMDVPEGAELLSTGGSAFLPVSNDW